MGNACNIFFGKRIGKTRLGDRIVNVKRTLTDLKEIVRRKIEEKMNWLKSEKVVGTCISAYSAKWKGTVCESMDCICQTHSKQQWWAFVNLIMICPVPDNAWNYLTSWETVLIVVSVPCCWSQSFILLVLLTSVFVVLIGIHREAFTRETDCIWLWSQ